MSNIIVDGVPRPRHSVVDRDRQNQNGLIIPNMAIYVQSGSLDGVTGSTTGSITMRFDAYGSRLKRIEVFHSGAAPSFDITLESKAENTGINFDPRKVIVEYSGLQGSDDYSSGIDRIEDLIALADETGRTYMKIKPFGSGDNTFKYLLFFEAVMVYVNHEGSFA